MIGLEKEIERRRRLNSKKLEIYEPVAYANIAKILNKPYGTAKRKIESGSLTVAEAILIYESLGFKPKESYDAFKYLFTEQGD